MNNYLLVTDQSWPEDNALFAELSKLNTQVTRYVLHQLDADANRAEPPTVEEERALSERLAGLAATLQARADRRAALGELPATIQGVAEHHPQALEPGQQPDTDNGPGP
jgi:hypothetical protein